VIPLREPGPIPEAIDLMRFLATSITFMVHLESVAVFLDENCIGRIEKTPGPAENIDLPDALNHSSPSETMVVTRLQRHRRSRSGCKMLLFTMALNQDSRFKLIPRLRFRNHRRQKFLLSLDSVACPLQVNHCYLRSTLPLSDCEPGILHVFIRPD